MVSFQPECFFSPCPSLVYVYAVSIAPPACNPVRVFRGCFLKQASTRSSSQELPTRDLRHHLVVLGVVPAFPKKGFLPQLCLPLFPSKSSAANLLGSSYNLPVFCAQPCCSMSALSIYYLSLLFGGVFKPRSRTIATTLWWLGSTEPARRRRSEGEAPRKERSLKNQQSVPIVCSVETVFQSCAGEKKRPVQCQSSRGASDHRLSRMRTPPLLACTQKWISRN